MNEQLQNALIEIIGKVNSGVDASVSFLSAEIPEVIHQLLLWYAVKSAITSIVAVGLCVVWFLAEKFILKKLQEHKVEFFEIIVFYGVIGSLVRTIPLAIICVMVNLDWMKIWIAPKIWLIEYASNLAK